LIYRNSELFTFYCYVHVSIPYART